MACDPFQFLRNPTESLGDRLFRTPTPDDLWMNAIPRGVYPQGIGVVRSTFTIPTSEPTSDIEAWDNITLTSGKPSLNDDGMTNACDINCDDVEVGFIERTYGPRKSCLRGPIVCKDDLIFGHQARKFFGAYQEQLAMRAKRKWTFQMRQVYIELADKVIDGNIYPGQTALNSNGINLPAVAATSDITRGILRSAAANLMYRGATKPDSSGYISIGPTGPMWTLQVGIDVLERLTHNDPEFRQDIRYAEPSALMASVGATEAIGNFRLAPTLIPPRYDFVGGKYIQRPTFTMDAVTVGKGANYNPAWIAAQYEGAVVISPGVFTAEVLQPINEIANMKWNPTNYLGEWEFVTGAYHWDNTCSDPLEKKGRHYAEFGYAPAPEHPEYGLTIIFKRCPQDNLLVYCS